MPAQEPYKAPDSRNSTGLQQDDAEIWTIVDGKITALTIYFDITEFRAFMGR